MSKHGMIIIGLDGGTFKIIDPLINAGKLPNIKKLIDGGTRTILNSTIPPVTAPAWVTFMTGKNPGKHGCFDFVKNDVRKSNYILVPDLELANKKHIHRSHDFAGQTIWDLLSQADYRLSVIMLPMTFPAWQINGHMLSGYPSPDFKNPSTYPVDWKNEIGELFDIAAISGGNKEKMIRECKKLIRKETEVLLSEMAKNDSDVFAIVFSSIDFVQHHLWKHIENPKSPYSDVINEVYEEVDAAIGQFIAAKDEDASVVIMSDHGFGPWPEKYFNTSAWLKDAGYLELKKQNLLTKISDWFIRFLGSRKIRLKNRLKHILARLPSAISQNASDLYYKTNQIDYSKTKAYRHKVGHCEGIIINLEGRKESGIVPEHEYESLRNEIVQKLKKLRDPNDPSKRLVREVFKREDIYHGQFTETVPDIILLLGQDYMGGFDVDGSIVTNLSEDAKDVLSGTHDMDGVLILNGKRLKNGAIIEPVEMVDVASTILFDLDLLIPEDMDGRVILEAFKEPFASEPVKYTQEELDKKKTENELSEDDQAKIEEALRGLGYLS